MLDILKKDDLMVSYKLPILDVSKFARISFPFQLFLFWHFNIITLINLFGERFASRLERHQPFRSHLDPGQKNLSRSHPGSGQKKNFDLDSCPRTTLTISTQCFLQCFRRIFITHELWQYDIQQKSYTIVKLSFLVKKCCLWFC